MPDPIGTTNPQPGPEQEVVQQDADYLEQFDFAQAKSHLQQLIGQFSTEVKKTESRRALRDVEINVKDLQRQELIDKDETYIPMRVINTNIEREKPPFINYLKGSRRLAIFREFDNPNEDCQEIEDQFTFVMTYPGWETAHFKCLDGSQAHAWDAVEVLFDESKPAHVGIEHIGHDRLIFSLDALDLQFCGTILRVYDLTVNQLKSFVTDFSFDQPQVDLVIASYKNSPSKKERTIRCYKKFCKYDGMVYVSWFTLELGANDWLKKPEPAYVGVSTQQQIPGEVIIDPLTQMPTQGAPQTIEQKEPLTIYPIFLLPYQETEKATIAEKKGRVYLDEGKQEALSAIVSAYVNGTLRASQVYGSPKGDTGDAASIKQLESVKLADGTILNKPFEFWHTQYPDPSILRGAQYLEASNQNETGQVNYAATNRQDSRKTAEEIKSAGDQQTNLNAVQVTLFSTYLRAVYGFCWYIVQSRALQGKITFLPLNGANDVERIAKNYDVRAAGDVDVIQRQEKIERMQTFWPVVQATVLAPIFLADLMKVAFPEDGARYAQILMTQGTQFQAMQQMLMKLIPVLMEVSKEHPEEAQGIQQLVMQIQQLLAPPPTQGAQPGQAQPPQMGAGAPAQESAPQMGSLSNAS